MVVETDWPAVCSGTAMSEPSIAISAAGQSQWVLGIRNVLSGLSGGHGIGIVYWEPAWVRSVPFLSNFLSVPFFRRAIFLSSCK
jgi:arabinogalactan endo-1,4-beta-galactosidase